MFIKVALVRRGFELFVLFQLMIVLLFLEMLSVFPDVLCAINNDDVLKNSRTL